MRGSDERSDFLFSYVSPEQQVPRDYPLRERQTRQSRDGQPRREKLPHKQAPTFSVSLSQNPFQVWDRHRLWKKRAETASEQLLDG